MSLYWACGVGLESKGVGAQLAVCILCGTLLVIKGKESVTFLFLICKHEAEEA